MDETTRRGPALESIPADVRRVRIAELLDERDFLRVTDIAQHFGISEVTARSDLAALAGRGRVRRVRGGAMSGPPSPEQRFELESGRFAAEKARIARAAAAHVSNGETVLLDVGTTTGGIARALLARADLQELVVITNALNVAWELEAAIPRFTVVVTGGTLRPLQHSLVEPLGATLLEGLHGHTLFLGCTGVDPVGGVTNVNLPEAGMKRRMMGAAARTIAVADGSKVGRITLARVCDVEDLDLLITDSTADARVLDALRERGVEVEVV